MSESSLVPSPIMGKSKQPLQTYGKHSSRFRSYTDMFFPDTSKIDFNPPKGRPKSQKEATMASEPPEESIEMIEAMGMADRVTAIRYLKAKHNNVEAAVNAILEHEDISKEEAASQWDEAAWATDRDGNDAEPNLRPLGASAAPTRGPSPAPGESRTYLHPTSKEQEDLDMAMAMENSQADLVMPFQQEKGVIQGDGTETKFGPATRDFYEEKQWAMVPSPQGTSEIVPDADVEQRQNTLGEPRFLKYLPNGDYLSNLLTICHAIPGAREALLMREHVCGDYGQDAEWWRGHPIALPKIVHVDDGSAANPQSDKYDELIAEVQRLMAVLDASERSYVSPSALTQTDVIKNATPTRTLLEFYLEEWIAAASAKSGEMGDMTNLFATDFMWASNDHEHQKTLLTLPVDVAEGETTNLAELLESFLWGHDTDTMTEADDFIEVPAEVLVMHLRQTRQDARQLRAEVPSQFYMDKYLEDNVSNALEVRRDIAKGKTRIEKISHVEQKLTTRKHPKKNEQLDTRAILKHTYGHFSGQNKGDSAKHDLPNGVPEDSETQPPHYQDIAEKLEKVIASVDNKLDVLGKEKEKTRKAISDMSKDPAPGMAPSELKHRYTLRGVATKPNITYVLRPKEEEEDEEMLLQQEDDTTPDGMQWWRIEYEVNATGSGAKITKTKTPDYDVIRAVELEHSCALLVYASDAAIDYTLHNPILPEPLQDFINHDNQLFRAELAAAQSAPPPYQYDNQDTVRPSIERDSMDSTRVEAAYDSNEEPGGASSPPGYGQDEFLEHPGFGLPPDIKQGAWIRPEVEGEEEAEVVEIKLDDEGEVVNGGGSEMLQTSAEPLIPSVKSGIIGSDAVMEDVASQDRGVGVGGDARHVEDPAMK